MNIYLPIHSHNTVPTCAGPGARASSSGGASLSTGADGSKGGGWQPRRDQTGGEPAEGDQFSLGETQGMCIGLTR